MSAPAHCLFRRRSILSANSAGFTENSLARDHFLSGMASTDCELRWTSKDTGKRNMKFPLPFVPKTSYKGGNGFNADRSGVRKGLRHAANDLAAEPGTPVLA